MCIESLRDSDVLLLTKIGDVTGAQSLVGSDRLEVWAGDGLFVSKLAQRSKKTINHCLNHLFKNVLRKNIYFKVFICFIKARPWNTWLWIRVAINSTERELSLEVTWLTNVLTINFAVFVIFCTHDSLVSSVASQLRRWKQDKLGEKENKITSWSLRHVIHVACTKTVVLQLCKNVILGNPITKNLGLYFLF